MTAVGASPRVSARRLASAPRWRELPLVPLVSLRLALAIVDWIVGVGVFVLASLVESGDDQWLGFWQRPGMDLRIASLIFATGWVGALWSQGLYAHRTSWPVQYELRRLARAACLVAVVTLASLYVVAEFQVGRLFLGVLFVSAPVAALFAHTVVRTVFGLARERGHSQRHLLIVGTGLLAQRFADSVDTRGALGIRVAGHLATAANDRSHVTRPILGGIDDLQRVLHTQIVDEIVVCVPPEQNHVTQGITELAIAEGKVVRNVMEQRRRQVRRTIEEDFGGFVVRSTAMDEGREVGFLVKRMLDVVGAVVGLALASPILLAAAVMVRRHDGGPALFRQTRVGLHGRLFTIYKFRTMVIDADDRFAEVEAMSETKGAAFKMVHDPRVTKIGDFLRKFSIDELPQLVNVLKGEMSLVGPRPAPQREVDAYDVWHRRRLSMKPGLTGLWQVQSRFDEDFDDRAALDLVYIERWSPALDLTILFQTLPAVFLRRGH